MTVKNRYLRIFLAMAIIAIACVGAYLLLDSQESDAAAHGSSSSPLSSLSITGYDVVQDSNTDYYVYVGSNVSIVPEGDGGGSNEFGYDVTGVTSGYGLTYESDYENPEGAGSGRVYGTISKAGNITVSAHLWQAYGDDENGSITIHAIAMQTEYTCYLYYDANGGYGEPRTQSYTGISTSSHIFTIPFAEPYREGYSFYGWSTSSSATSATYHPGETVSVKYNGSKTLYAVWKENAPAFEITIYKGNWDSFRMEDEDTGFVTASSKTYTIASDTVINVDWYGKASESGSGTDYTYTTSYTSSNYNMASSLYGASLGDSVTVTGEASYYPAAEMASQTVYTYNYTIQYDANGGTGAPDDTVDTSTSPSKTIVLSDTQPTRSGYRFLGWAESSNATAATYIAGSSYTFDYGTTNLYAVWKQSGLTIRSVSEQYAVVGQGVSFTASCTPYNVSVSYAKSNVANGLTVTISGSTITCNASAPGTYTFTLTASASGYSPSSTTVTVQFVPVLAFTNAPSIGVIGS